MTSHNIEQFLTSPSLIVMLFINEAGVFQPFLLVAPLLYYVRYLAAPLAFFNGYKDQGNVTIGGTLDAISRHPSVPRHPSWSLTKAIV